MPDLYFQENYGRLYEEVEKGKCENFSFRHPLGTVDHLFIKRQIPFQISGQTYYDLVTPYGYGGPLMTGCLEKDKQQLAHDFKVAFQQHCEQNQIVSEFIRFHPIINNAKDFAACYDVVHLRNTVGTNLKDYDDPVQHEYSKSKRKSIRQALEAGVTFTVQNPPSDLEAFKKIYYCTMEANEAHQFYFFGDAYFEKLLTYFGQNLLLVEVSYEGRIIGMSLNFLYEKTVHIHLSGTMREFNYLSPAFIMRYALAVWGKENGVELIHEGGGRTNAPDDSLYLFKKQFGKNTSFSFYVARQIWNESVYHQLCEAMGTPMDSDYFPTYRSALSFEFN
ncbi:GNAT family N-acetyltransferase [Planomicrobium chinense]|uniref:GNAT family N-acetyltransferase n=1 Tax=Planococcus chinensis TaxID=272917 RepID=UPI001CC63011|nr:GNAT family N-acetyltransferase [Planococcus chinensis]MBZ5202687.1 GNAT family N-acetyltransferase [Planococcus chinensis]